MISPALCSAQPLRMSLQKSERNVVVKFLGSNWKIQAVSAEPFRFFRTGNKMLIFIWMN